MGTTPDSDKSAGKPITRRVFIGLVAAGLVTLLVGRELWSESGSGAGSASGVGSGSRGTFRIRSIARGPRFDEAAWTLTLDGLFRRPLTLTYNQFLALPQVERTRDFDCVEGWSVTGVRWKGVTVRELVKAADIDPRATHLVFHSGDGVYTDSLTLDEALRDDTLLAHEADGKPLGPDNGSPLRLVLPGSYAYKSVKWVVRVEAIAAADPGPDGYQGYWEKRGYPADARVM